MTLAAVALVLLAGVAAAWWFESSAPLAASPVAATSPSSDATSTTGTYRVRVTRDGRELASFDLAQLQAIGMKSVVLQGGTETGPTLIAVLQRAGAAEYAGVTIIGAGTRDSGRLELSAADIGPDVVLDIAKRGTVKVAGPNITYASRVRDITEIQVR
jgi:hypothetical protein